MKDFEYYFKDKVIGDVMRKLPEAQRWLDGEIMNNMEPYMPKDTGTFVNEVRMRNASLIGSGQVCVYTGVQGAFLYYGKKMMNAKTGKGPRVIPLSSGEVIFRWPEGSKLVATNEPLTYSNPEARPEWDEYAKSLYLEKWKEGVAKILNGK